MSRRPARIFSIPFGAPFLDALVDALLTGPLKELVDFAGDPLALASTVIHVPTRRAARALTGKLTSRLRALSDQMEPSDRQEFALNQYLGANSDRRTGIHVGGICSSGKAVLLPRIVPLGETDAWEFETSSGMPDMPGLPAAIGAMQRRLLLAKLVAAWSASVDRDGLKLDEEEAFAVASGAASILSLAADLASLVDGMHLEALPLDTFRKLDAAEFQEMWRQTASFLGIAGERWPEILAEKGLLDPADRHGRLVRAHAARLAEHGSPHPVIVAGSTGSIAATAELLAAIARLPNGAVVLPGLDRDLDARSWSLLDGDGGTPSHPQYALRRLLDRIGVGPDEVAEIGAPAPALATRAHLFTEAMRPATTTDAWRLLANRAVAPHNALSGMTVIEAPDERIEALAIALVLREAIEHPDKVAALITPDRGLAERVLIELARWDIAADDSAGVSLSRTAAGRLTLLLAELSLGIEATTLVGLLRHPSVRLGLDPDVVPRGAAAIEIALLRGQRLPADIRALKTALQDAETSPPDHPPRPRGRLGNPDFAAAYAVIDALADALDPLMQIMAADQATLVDVARAHADAFDAVARATEGTAATTPDAEALAELFADLAQCDDAGPSLALDSYPRLFRALMDERAVSLPTGGHRRVKIWGLLEARLLEADVTVLGGLVEGTWPARPGTDPFLNRAMRAQLGLSPPERRIGQMAHDFVTACATQDCVLVRPLRAQGSDTIPSRFLQRLKAVAGEPAWTAAVARGDRYVSLARMLDTPARIASVRQPSPFVSASLQPLRLSVTEVETLLRDPYAIFARKVLELDALDPLGLDFDPSLQGSLWHAALEAFAKAYPTTLPASALDDLLAIGRDLIGKHMRDPQVEGFVWPRFRRAARWFIDWERDRRRDIARVVAETRVTLDIPLDDGALFCLAARPDRVEYRRDRTLVLVDFKTGVLPAPRDVLDGFSPQLTLEAAILAAGGVPGVPAAPVSELLHVKLSGAAEPGKAVPVNLDRSGFASVEDIAAAHLAGLREVLGAYRRGERGFTAHPFPGKAPVFGDYGHLARVAEWADEGAQDGGQDGGLEAEPQ